MTISTEKLRSCLLDLSNPIAQRTHAAFLLRTRGDDECVDALAEALKNREDSSLMRHELAYILGQIGNTRVIPMLTTLLETEDEDVLVRHESAEALGAIGSVESLPVLRQFSTHELHEVAETCQIAVDLIEWRKQQAEAAEAEKVSNGGYLSVDPAPAVSETKSIETLTDELMDTEKSLFLRYRAMFALRNYNNDAAALALVSGFSDSSALFRHEIAYVLGQMQRAVTVPGLTEVLQNLSEHRMVRHEAAEALGAIGGDEVEKTLASFREDSEKVVQESCSVALDTIEYWASDDYDASAQQVVEA